MPLLNVNQDSNIAFVGKSVETFISLRDWDNLETFSPSSRTVYVMKSIKNKIKKKGQKRIKANVLEFEKYDGQILFKYCNEK